MTRTKLWIGAGILGLSGVATALPWDLDMADGQAVKAYAAEMPALPAGVIAQDNLLSPKGHTTNAQRGSADAKKLLAPVATDERLALGAQMYGIYCSPCHGADGTELGPIAKTDRAPDRFGGISILAGPSGVAQTVDDSWIYLTIRNGGAKMPSYGHAMSDEEMWAIVHHIRTLPDAAYLSPDDAPEAPEEGNP